MVDTKPFGEHGIQQLHTLDDKNTLMDLNNMLFWDNLGNRKTRGRWAHIFSKLREEDNKLMLDRFISKDIDVGGHI